MTNFNVKIETQLNGLATAMNALKTTIQKFMLQNDRANGQTGQTTEGKRGGGD